jgi:MoaA/NifB/PqqE/SkfB family radical SAM enzyme
VTCGFWKKEWEDPISTDAAVHLIERLSDLGVQVLCLTGGEPLLRQDLFEVLQRAETQRFDSIVLITNGLLLKKMHEHINDSPITHVSVSIDALGEKNDMIRGVKGHFEAALEGAQLMRSKEVIINASLTGPGANDLESLINLAERHNWSFQFNLLDDRRFYIEDSDVTSVWPGPVETEKIIKILKRRLNRPDYELDYVRQYLLSGGSMDGPDEPQCVQGFTTISITADGNVWSGCYSLPPMGNFFQEDVARIVGSDSYRDRCLAMLHRECPGCTFGGTANLWFANNFNGLFGSTTRLLSSLAQRAASALR